MRPLAAPDRVQESLVRLAPMTDQDTETLLAAWHDAALAADLAERLAGEADQAAREEGLPSEAVAAAAEMAQQAAHAAARAADLATEAAEAYLAADKSADAEAG